jgi:hypothetical protein
MSESTLLKKRAAMSTHLFPAHMTHRYEHDIPESFLIVAGAILTALVILVALAAAVAVAYPLHGDTGSPRYSLWYAAIRSQATPPRGDE